MDGKELREFMGHNPHYAKHHLPNRWWLNRQESIEKLQKEMQNDGKAQPIPIVRQVSDTGSPMGSPVEQAHSFPKTNNMIIKPNIYKEFKFTD